MGKKKILLIEDDGVCTQLIRLVTRGENVKIFSANDGEQGLKEAEAMRPDLIFLDIMLPKMDGYVVARKLKSNPDTASIPIVVLSARAGTNGERMIIETGCEAFIYKPFKALEIKEAIKKFVH